MTATRSRRRRFGASLVSFTACEPDSGERTYHQRGAQLGWRPPMNSLPPNNRLVIYELPTRWTSNISGGSTEVSVGTF